MDYNFDGMKVNQELLSLSLKNLNGTIRDRQKMADRVKFLSEHPEAKRRIDTRKLRQIIDYQDFKCHPQCSVAKDQAVVGSDIDGAIVVLKSETSIQQQISFVEELRKQGFSAFHQSEVQVRKQQLDEAEAKGIRLSEGLLELSRKYIKADNAEIKFYTTSQLEEMKTKPLDSPVMIYVAGYSIK